MHVDIIKMLYFVDVKNILFYKTSRNLGKFRAIPKIFLGFVNILQ